jgi:predicted transcriptional regulator
MISVPDTMTAQVTRYLHAHPGWSTNADIAAGMSADKAAVCSALGMLCVKGIVEQEHPDRGRGRKATPQRYRWVGFQGASARGGRDLSAPQS